MNKNYGRVPAAQVRIRKARPGDMPGILDIYSAAFAGVKRASPAKAAKIFARMKSYPDYNLYVAVSAGRAAGVFALLIMDNLVNDGTPSAVVEDVAVSPAWQGRGVGKMMMRFALDACRKAGCYKMALSSNRKRVSAHRFYESLGFKRHGYSYLVNINK